jgi:hypothetical protein
MTDPMRNVIGAGWAPRMGIVFPIAKDNTGMPLAGVDRLLDADECGMRLVAVYDLSAPGDLATTVDGRSAEWR